MSDLQCVAVYVLILINVATSVLFRCLRPASRRIGRWMQFDPRFCYRCNSRIRPFGPDSAQASLTATVGHPLGLCQVCTVTDRLSGAIRQLDRGSTVVGEVLLWLHSLWLVLLSINTYVVEREELIERRREEQRIEETDAPDSDEEDGLLANVQIP